MVWRAGKGLETRLYATCSGGYVIVVAYYVILVNSYVIINSTQMPVVVVVNVRTSIVLGTWCVRCGHKYVPRGAVECVLRNYITCTNLIGAALLTAAEQVACRRVTRPFLSG